MIQSIKGIGPKTAQRVILELKDKVGKHSDLGSIPAIKTSFTMQDEALAALVSLGIAKNMAEKALGKAMSQGEAASVEALIKQALKVL